MQEIVSQFYGTYTRQWQIHFKFTNNVLAPPFSWGTSAGTRLFRVCGFCTPVPVFASGNDILHFWWSINIQMLNNHGGNYLSYKNLCSWQCGIFVSEARGIRENFQVELLQDQAQLMLNDYIMTQQSNNKFRFGKLLLMLPVLRTLSPRAMEDVFFRRTIGSIPIERLLCDMFKSSWLWLNPVIMKLIFLLILNLCVVFSAYVVKYLFFVGLRNPTALKTAIKVWKPAVESYFKC